jgi:hypothetical protein
VALLAWFGWTVLADFSKMPMLVRGVWLIAITLLFAFVDLRHRLQDILGELRNIRQRLGNE